MESLQNHRSNSYATKFAPRFYSVGYTGEEALGGIFVFYGIITPPLMGRAVIISGAGVNAIRQHRFLL